MVLRPQEVGVGPARGTSSAGCGGAPGTVGRWGLVIGGFGLGSDPMGEIWGSATLVCSSAIHEACAHVKCENVSCLRGLTNCFAR